MQYRTYGKSGVQVSVIGLGGHEFRSNGKIKGFHDDSKKAIQPGYIFPDFGGEERETLVKKALEAGINFFDVTIDSEKEALGRIFKKLQPSEELLIQTRPEGMVYNYDPQNRKMGDYQLLRNEVIRIIGLLQREALDILNVAFMKSALDADPDFMDKMIDNITKLKQEGLIRFANADTFSGNDVYLRQIHAGCFDSVYIHYNVSEKQMEEQVIPAAAERSMAIITRELFMKGKLFQMAEEAGIPDRNLVAKAGMKWTLRDPRISSAVIGVANAEQLQMNLRVLEDLTINKQEQHVLDQICKTELYQQEADKKRNDFFTIF
ncbi:MAG: NADP-dependent oxidoreductase domain [Bacilli bacterium]|nr:NADP-dependent oxidoreductase domain [Bacilli bacterium]